MKDNIFEEEIIKSETVYEGPVFKIEKNEVLLPSGVKARRDVLRHLGAVCVIPIDSNGCAVMVRQYRSGYGGVTLEIPAGKLDSKEEVPLLAAKRELREEVGATAKKWTYLGEYYGSPAIVDEKIYMYLAEELTFGECDPDEDEIIEPERISLGKLKDMAMSGELPDGKTQCAVLRAYLMKKQEKQRRQK